VSDDKQQSEGQVSDAESLADAGQEIYPDQATAGFPTHPEDDDNIDGATGVEGSKPQEGTAGPNASPYSGKPTNDN
jgi:hypothetical protein